MRFIGAIFVSIGFATSFVAGQPGPMKYDPPKLSDPRLTVELVAAAPDIVHPIAVDFDAKGRLLVIESHTHFAPRDYKGPKFDRIRMVDPSLGARARKFTTFFEGTRHTMDLAVHPDGSVYIATRNEILRLRDTKNSGVADEKARLVFLDTKGDYPHKEFWLGPPPPPKPKPLKEDGADDDDESSIISTDDDAPYRSMDVPLRETFRIIDDAIDMGQRHQHWAADHPPLAIASKN